MVNRSSIVTLDGHIAVGHSVHYEELPENGPVIYNGTTYDGEFSAPLDLLDSNLSDLTVGSHVYSASIIVPEQDGIVTVKRAPAVLSDQPMADLTVSIDGTPLALFYSGATSVSPPSRSSVVILSIAPSTGPTPAPPPLGQMCGAPQASDPLPADAPPELQVEAGWFNADSATLYTTLQVKNVPASAPTGQSYWWVMNWRDKHSGYYARAALDDSGNWSFDYGGYNRGFYHLGDVTGEVQTGADGFIRVRLPRSLFDYRDGELLRDTTASSWVSSTAGAAVLVDSTSHQTDPTWGTGGDYELGPICGAPVPLNVVSRKFHGALGSFDINLPLVGTPGLECRSGGNDQAFQIVFTFPSNVTFNNAGVTSGTATVADVNGNGTREVSVDLTGVGNAQTITLSLLGLNDGNRTGDLNVPMSVLLGDVNATGRVDAADVSLVRQQTLQPVGYTNFREDINGSGRIDAADVSIARQQTLTSLP
jgi:hypothetical protein